MSLWRHLSRGLRVLTQRRAADEELADEVHHYTDQAAAEFVESGLSPEEARRAARLEVGNMDAVREQIREHGWESVFDSSLADLRYGLRMLRESPSFTFVAVLTLALGVGVNTAIFSLVDCLVLRPLPVERPERVVFVISSWKGGGVRTSFSYPDFREIQAQTSNIFSGVTASQPFAMDGLSGDGKSQSMWASYVTGNFFDVLGVKPALGRLILPTEGSVMGADPVLVISYAYWESRFNGDPDVVGKKVTVNGHSDDRRGHRSGRLSRPHLATRFAGLFALGHGSHAEGCPDGHSYDSRQHKFHLGCSSATRNRSAASAT
jgi:putative ABC transport system permease protein